MRNHFKIEGPAAISFSGWRTSAFMLFKIIEAHGGKLPDDVVVCFANTGKELEETLRFVDRCSREWNVPIAWLEYRRKTEEGKQFAKVDFDTASRNGEPFEAVILDRKYLPNPFARFCTIELKVRVMHRYLKSIGFTEWDSVIGIRADEPRRVAKMRANPHDETPYETKTIPLADAGVGVDDVLDFWQKHHFDLELLSVNKNTLLGNCDLCFLKSADKVQGLIQQKPDRALWWIKQEETIRGLGKFKGEGAKFHSQRPSYRQMYDYALAQHDWVGHSVDQSTPCFCGD